MELKGVEKVNNVINEFVRQFYLESEMGEDFSYYYPINKITWSFLMTEDSNRAYKTFLNKHFPDIDCNIFVWSILHEVGHHETIDEWDGDDQYEFDIKKENLEQRLVEEDEFKVCSEYYEIPDEMKATTWAAEYIREHKEEIDAFYEKFKKVVYEFVELNDVDLTA